MLNLAVIRARLPAPLAALTLVALAVVVWASPASAVETTTLTASVTPQPVTYPGSAVVSGTITAGAAPVSRAALTLLVRPAASADWAPAGSTESGSGGAFSFSVKPAVTSDYRVEYAGDSDHAAAWADVSLRVRPRVTTSFPPSLWLGGAVVLRGAVAPAHAGGTVFVDRRVGGAWQVLATAALGEDSTFSVRWTPAEFDYFRLRARIDADADHDPGASRSRLVIVNRPNAHRVPYRYKHYIVIVRHEYRLYYYEHGALVRRFDVALGRPGYRTPLGLFRVYGKRKPAGGALGACAMFYRRRGGIAMHGTDQPYLLRRPTPRDFSHGCARMLNREALWLYARVPVGTRVHNLH